jgi:hypothetical protein
MAAFNIFSVLKPLMKENYALKKPKKSKLIRATKLKVPKIVEPGGYNG